MADYGPGYDPSQAQFESTTDCAIGGLIGLAAFGAIGIGAFFAAEALGAVTGYAVSDVTYIVASQEVAEAWAAVDYALANGLAIPTAATDVLTAASASAPAFLANSTLNSLAAIIALNNYQILPLNLWNLGGHGVIPPDTGSGGGVVYIPGYPDFPGGGHGWRRYCYTVATPQGGSETVCYYED